MSPQPPGLGYTLTAGLQSPEAFWERLKGYGTGVLGIGKGIGQGAINLAQAALNLTPPGLAMGGKLQLPGASSPPINTTRDVGAIGPVADLGNAITFGLPEALAKRYGQSQTQDPQPRTLERDATNLLKGAGQFAVRDITPFADLRDWYRGDKPVGFDPQTGEDIRQKLEPGELSEKEISILMKFLPLAGVSGKFLVGKPAKLPIKDTLSIGEIMEAQGFTGSPKDFLAKIESEGKIPRAKPGFGEEAWKAKAQQTRENLNPLKYDTSMPEELAQHFTVAKMMASDDIKPVILEAYTSNIGQELIRTAPPGTRNFDLLSMIVENNGLGPDTLANLATKFNLPVDTSAKLIAKVMNNSAHEAAKILESGSEAQQLALAQATWLADVLKNKKAVQALNNMKKITSGSEPATIWQKLNGMIRGEENFRRGMMVSQIKTFVRNIEVQGINAGPIDALENGLTAMFQKMGAIKPGQPKGASWYHDAAEVFTSAFDFLKPAEGSYNPLTTSRNIAALNDIFTNQPILNTKLFGQSAFETGNSILGNLRKGILPKSLGEAAQILTDITTFPLHLQEMGFRRFIYKTRLETNLRELGFKDIVGENGKIIKTSLEQYNEALQQPKVPVFLKEASADALVHTLKQTFAYTPEGGLGGAVLKLYNQYPILTAIGPSFPRFMINKFIWLMERSPTNFFKIFNKDFQARLATTVEDGGLASKFAARELAKATSGTMMFAAAMAMEENPEKQGPKYYLIPTGEDEMVNGVKRKVFRDFRPYDPFITIKALAHIGRLTAEGKEPNLTADEWTDLAAGVRRAQDLLIFNFMDELRASAQNENGIASGAFQAMAKKVGLHFASFMAVPRMAQDYISAAKQEPVLYRDIKDQPLTGGVMSVLKPNDYIPRTNIFTGQPEMEESPGLAQTTGAAFKRMNSLEELVRGLPDINLGDLPGRHQTAVASNLVAKYVGQKLSTQTPDGKTIADVFVNKVKSLNLPIKLQREIVIEFFKRIRESGALDSALAEDASKNGGIPIHFIEDELKQKSPVEREQARKALQQKNIQYPR
jgi:hypothetical protein